MIKNIQPQELENLLISLLDKKQFNINNSEIILNRHGWNFNDNFICVVLSTLEYNPYYLGSADASFRLGPSIFENSCILLYKGFTVIVTNLTTAQITRDDEIYGLNQYFKVGKLSGGISQVFNNLELLESFYCQAKIALSHALEEDDYTCHKFDDYALQFMLTQCLGDFLPEAFCPLGLLQLIKIDQQKNKEYTLLLRTYLENNMNIAQTIKQLYIHRSTFLYRIDRIKEILQVDLNNSDERLQLLIALKLLEMK